MLKAKNSNNKKAVLLLSGGIDSSTVLYYAKNKGFKCSCLIFNYGQRHLKELKSAIKIAKASNSPFKILPIGLPWKGSSLIDKSIKIPIHRNIFKFDRSSEDRR